jgi:hypothetical protein
MGASTRNCALAPLSPGVSIERCNTDQRCYLPSVEVSEFGQGCDRSLLYAKLNEELRT